MLVKSLEKNTAITSLNLFKNKLDVDGCRALREFIKVNKNLEILDIGHNRIRIKGLEEIRNGLLGAANSKLKTLGLRMNFLNDEGVQVFFDKVVMPGISKLESIYIGQNNISVLKTTQLYA